MRKALLLLLAAWLALPALAPAAEPLDRIVAVVNDDVITATELAARIDLVRRQLEADGTPIPPRDELARQVLEREILDRIQLQAAAAAGIQVDDTTVDQALRNLARDNGLGLDRFRELIESQGYPYARFREDLRRQITIGRLRQRAVFSRIQVQEHEIRRFLEREDPLAADREYRLGHILVALPEGATPERIEAARRRAEAILERLRAGADFARTAVAESDGQQALAGGDLGWRKPGQLPTPFVEEVRRMRPGEIAGPIRTASGFHIIKLLEVRGGEARRRVTQTHARHILVRTSAVVDDTEARRRLLLLRARALAGEDFAALARAHSEDPVSAAEGGDLGWVGPGDVVPEFEKAMAALAPGEISEPFRTRFGWHIVQVLGRRSHDNTEEARREEAVRQIRRRKSEEELALWLQRLRDEAHVEVRLGSG
ncbi:peptidylprolyl isomerase [Inmirania thermothiophila]|uniref:Chaperone SurA n=1 Tax=Inmirania thermothiophila TaxID=1750597 RepID=A0A3N1Y826_9GAMM|nr:peptidylprolyl isomerase [Inmirania thermothiophila]ROR34671.1 periplasmic chaperone for outer membrane proteins SurA [Inmirania thermothiophila]